MVDEEGRMSPTLEPIAERAFEVDVVPDVWCDRLPEFERRVRELLPIATERVTADGYALTPECQVGAWAVKPLAVLLLLEGYADDKKLVDLVATKFVRASRRRSFRRHVQRLEKTRCWHRESIRTDSPSE